jgi:hypothetical protein
LLFKIIFFIVTSDVKISFRGLYALYSYINLSDFCSLSVFAQYTLNIDVHFDIKGKSELIKVKDNTVAPVTGTVKLLNEKGTLFAEWSYKDSLKDGKARSFL